MKFKPFIGIQTDAINLSPDRTDKFYKPSEGAPTPQSHTFVSFKRDSKNNSPSFQACGMFTVVQTLFSN